jgi:DNA-directed RNA polymerase subunit beta'
MAKYTVGQYLVQSTMPKGYEFDSTTVDKKVMSKGLIRLAKEKPDLYVDAVSKLKRIGDEFATVEGVSVGLDDISPDYKARNPIVNKYHTLVRKTDDPKQKIKYLMKAQDELLTLTKGHKGDMGLMARSGGRGKPAQLMKTVTTPIAVNDFNGNVIPWMVKNSYAEGLKPSELWVTAGESRKNTIESMTSVTEPGELGKLVTNTMFDQVVRMDDCGTDNGVGFDSCDYEITDRYLAHSVAGYPKNTLVTPQIMDALCKKKVRVVIRSPMTCDINDGLCAKCYGVTNNGHPPPIGTNLGTRSGQAISEPLTQALLSAKHAAGIAGGDGQELTGYTGVKLLTRVPEVFSNASVLAVQDGTVTGVDKAPQGGFYIHVDKKQHYVPPTYKVLVKKDQTVEAGDRLSSGVPKPNEVMQYKGIGVGRQYYTDALYNVFNKSITNLDKRHFELLSKAQLSHGVVTHDPLNILQRGDTVNYNTITDRLKENTENVSVKDSVGKTLAKSYQEFLAGTLIKPSIQKELTNRGLKNVETAVNPPEIQFLMRPISHAPLLHPDWLAKLGHRYLSKTIKDAASFGEVANIHSTHPIPAFIYGTEFGKGSSGEY